MQWRRRRREGTSSSTGSAGPSPSALRGPYFPGTVKGRENLPVGGAYIVAPVHRSYVDWLIVARITRRQRLRYIVKEEVWKSKLIGRLLLACGAFPVNRSGADREALQRCHAGSRVGSLSSCSLKAPGAQGRGTSAQGRSGVPVLARKRPGRSRRHRRHGTCHATRVVVSTPEAGEHRDRTADPRPSPAPPHSPDKTEDPAASRGGLG